MVSLVDTEASVWSLLTLSCIRIEVGAKACRKFIPQPLIYSIINLRQSVLEDPLITNPSRLFRYNGPFCGSCEWLLLSVYHAGRTQTSPGKLIHWLSETCLNAHMSLIDWAH